MNYCDELTRQCRVHANRRLMLEVDTGREITFGELLRNVEATAAYLLRSGIGPENAVAIHMYNSIDATVMHAAVQYIGGISCFVDALVQPKSLDYYVEMTDAKLLVTHVRKERLPEAVTRATTVLEADDVRTISSGAAPRDLPPPASRARDEVCYVYFTSGTTSRPKGVMLSPGNHENFTRICDTYWKPVTSSSKHICYVPFSHGFGTVFLVPLSIRTASELFLMRAFHPLRVMDAVEKHGITHIYGVPSHYRQLLRMPNAKARLKGLAASFCAAAKLEHELMLEWEEATGVMLCEGYGLIETCCGIVWRTEEPSLGTGHMGPCPDPSLVEVDILDPETHEPLCRGEIGEIAVRGKSVMKGYLKNKEETSRVMQGGRFLTGDKGYIDENGQLFMTGRIKDIINIAGIKISPYEVEAVLNKHPDVTESAVVSAPDPLYGEVVKAYVRRRKDAAITERDLIRFAAEHLINFQVPKQIDFVDAFPLNNMGKLDKSKLKAVNDSR